MWDQLLFFIIVFIIVNNGRYSDNNKNKNNYFLVMITIKLIHRSILGISLSFQRREKYACY